MVGIAIAQTGGRARRQRWVPFAAVGCGLFTALLIVAYLASQARQPQVINPATAPVVVSSKAITPATTITADMLTVKKVTPGDLAQTAFTQPKDVVGKIARYDVPAGAQIVPTMLLVPGSSDALSFVVPPGKRAVAVAAGNVSGAGNHIRPGDNVDVLVNMDVTKLSSNLPAAGGGRGVVTLLQNVQVLAVAANTQKLGTTGPQDKANPDNLTGGDPGGSVMLAVDPTQAELLFLAETEGTIRLTLRSFGDQDQLQVPAVLEPLAGSIGATQAR
ncbi:MAG TPA: Flp pilus assembly protein CpaB [Dehalococcoidia bacterium]|nr:Flp pilus assembly protein CpaB [Dehalococcoidia bacterium]